MSREIKEDHMYVIYYWAGQQTLIQTGKAILKDLEKPTTKRSYSFEDKACRVWDLGKAEGPYTLKVDSTVTLTEQQEQE